MRFGTLNEWLQWQETLHPKKIDLGLERVASVWRKVWTGQTLPFRVITVAGTNGKGSSVALLEAMLSAAGYRVGCFTSPHLVRYNERIRIAGRDADDDLICAAFERIDRARGTISISYFEFSALAALQLFCDAKLDVAVLEVGLGGRLDAVNIVDSDVALITTIGLDHTEWLGHTLDEIAREKAGIMRARKPVVCASPSAPESLIEHARQLQALPYLAGRDFFFRQRGSTWDWWSIDERMEGLPLPALQGGYQLQNAAGVVMALRLLLPRLPLQRMAIEQGLRTVQVPGRFQLISGVPNILLDVAHNAEAVKMLAENLEQLPRSGQTRAVFGIMSDKDVQSVVAIIAAQVDKWYLADLGVSRGMQPHRLAHVLVDAAVERAAIEQYPNGAAAFDGAMAEASGDDLILVFGSFWLVGDILSRFR